MAYEFPGNVRELENLIERMVVLKKDEVIDLADLPPKILGAQVSSESGPFVVGAIDIPDAGIPFKRAVADFEAQLIAVALKKTGGNKNKAASLLHLNRTTLVEKIKKKRMDVQDVE